MRTRIVVPINSEMYRWEIVRRIHDIYGGWATKCHVALVGSEINKVKHLVARRHVTSTFEIPTPGFNYSYSMNLTIRDNLSKGNFRLSDIIIISDGYTIVSVAQLESALKGIDFDKNFVELPVYSSGMDSVNWSSKRLMLSILSLLKRIKSNPAKAKMDVPVIITSVKHYIQSIHGLDECIFTKYARLRLSQQLENFGLNKLTNIEPEGISFLKTQSWNEFYRQYVKQDISKIEQLANNYKQDYFIPNNVGIEFGSSERMTQLKMKDGYLYWTGDADKLITVEDTPDKIPGHGVEITSESDKIELPTSNKFKPTNTELNGDVLILLDNLIENVICTTPLIKALYFQYANVDILTNRKVFEPINMLNNMMVRNIYELADLQKGVLKLPSYEKIIRTHGCGIKLASKDIKTIDCNLEPTLFETNSHPKGIKFSVTEFPPYCTWKPKRMQIPENCVMFLSSMYPKTYRQLDEEYTSGFNRLLEKLILRNLNVMVLNLKDEINPVPTVMYKKNTRNFYMADKVDMNDSAILLNNSSFIVTSPYTSAYWLSQGLNTRTLVLTDDPKVQNQQHSNHHYFFDYREKDIEDYMTGLILKHF